MCSKIVSHQNSYLYKLTDCYRIPSFLYIPLQPTYNTFHPKNNNFRYNLKFWYSKLNRSLQEQGCQLLTDHSFWKGYCGNGYPVVLPPVKICSLYERFYQFRWKYNTVLCLGPSVNSVNSPSNCIDSTNSLNSWIFHWE